MNLQLKQFAKHQYAKGKSDVYAMFIERLVELAAPNGSVGIMAPFTWMFISSYEKLRTWMIEQKAITTLVQPEYHAFFDSAYVPICAFVVRNARLSFKGDYFRLTDFYGEDVQATKLLEGIANPSCGWRFQSSAIDFQKLPGNPIAYWISDRVRRVFEQGIPLSTIANPTGGMTTGDNGRFLRLWYEVSQDNFGKGIEDRATARKTGKKWFPYNCTLPEVG
jgi:hypothetical protein